MEISLPTPTISIVNNQPATTSLAIAEHFDKDHGKVIRDIRSLIAKCPSDFTEANFGLSNFNDSTGRSLPMYTVYFDGFILLVMGYTGKKALQIKLAYIAAFNAMRERLAAQPFRNPEKLPDTPITPDQQCTLQAMVKALVGRGGHYANIWSRFNNHFRLGSYKQLPQSRMSEAIDYLMRLPVEPKKLPPSPTVAKNATTGIASGELMPTPGEMDKRRERICRELYELQDKFGRLIDEIRLCLHPGARWATLPPELDAAYETLVALNRVAAGGSYTARQAVVSAYHIGKGLKFV